MARRASLVMLTKWVVVPVALAAVGFFVLGPVLEGKAAAASAPPSTAPDEEKPRFTSEPDVDVSVAPATRRRSTTTRARTPARTRRRLTPAPEVPPEVPTPDAEPTIDHGIPPPTSTVDGGG